MSRRNVESLLLILGNVLLNEDVNFFYVDISEVCLSSGSASRGLKINSFKYELAPDQRVRVLLPTSALITESGALAPSSITATFSLPLLASAESFS